MPREGKTGDVFRDRSGIPTLYRAHLIMSPDITVYTTNIETGIGRRSRIILIFFPKRSFLRYCVIPAVPGAVIP